MLVAGRRFGKTFLAIPELCQAVWGKPDSVAWYLAPTYRQAKQVAWLHLKAATYQYLDGKPNETDLSVKIRGGGVIALRGADNYDSLRGPGLNFIVLDEFADMAPEAWTEVLRPALSDRLGKAMFIGTPKGYNHFYELYQKASTEPDWATFQYTTIQGGIVTEDEIEKARRDLDPKTFRQEYEATFETFEGRAYYGFKRANNLRQTEYDPRFPLCWSLDFNVNPMASVIGQIEDRSDRMDVMMNRRRLQLNVLDEIYIPNGNTPEACQEFVNRTQQYAAGKPLTVRIYGDASGSQRQTAVGAGANSDWTVIRDFFARRSDYLVDFRYQRANDSVRDRVASVNAAFCNTLGERRCFVDPRCKNLITDLDKVCWKPGTFILDPGSDRMQTHPTDALGYLIWVEMGVRQAASFRREMIV